MSLEQVSSGGQKENLLTCLADLFHNIATQKRRVGTIAPKRFIAKLKRENGWFRVVLVDSLWCCLETFKIVGFVRTKSFESQVFIFSRIFIALIRYHTVLENMRRNRIQRRKHCLLGVYEFKKSRLLHRTLLVLCIAEIFDNYMQQDAHEFLNYLLNTISETLADEKRNEKLYKTNGMMRRSAGVVLPLYESRMQCQQR